MEQERIRAGLMEKQQATKAIAVVFLGVLLSLILSTLLSVSDQQPAGDTSLPSTAELLIHVITLVLVGLFAIVLLGRATFRRTLGAGTTIGNLGMGILAAIPAFLISYLYVSVLSVGQEDSREAAIGLSLASILVFCLMPALLEEWLCRGVLWQAVRRVASSRNTILITSLLFAMMHGLGGGGVLEFPHRFTAGLVFGWLRLRTGSLLPGMLAHFCHNLLCLAV